MRTAAAVFTAVALLSACSSAKEAVPMRRPRRQPARAWRRPRRRLHHLQRSARSYRRTSLRSTRCGRCEPSRKGSAGPSPASRTAFAPGAQSNRRSVAGRALAGGGSRRSCAGAWRPCRRGDVGDSPCTRSHASASNICSPAIGGDGRRGAVRRRWAGRPDSRWPHFTSAGSNEPVVECQAMKNAHLVAARLGMDEDYPRRLAKALLGACVSPRRSGLRVTRVPRRRV